MAIAVRTGTTVSYILHQDRSEPASKQTVFRIRQGLSARARAHIQDAMISLRVDGIERSEGRLGSMHYAAVQVGVADWSNLLDEHGREVTAELFRLNGVEALTDESMDRIAPYIPELAQQVIEANRLNEDDAGNSASSPASRQGESSQTGSDKYKFQSPVLPAAENLQAYQEARPARDVEEKAQSSQ